MLLNIDNGRKVTGAKCFHSRIIQECDTFRFILQKELIMNINIYANLGGYFIAYFENVKRPTPMHIKRTSVFGDVLYLSPRTAYRL